MIRFWFLVMLELRFFFCSVYQSIIFSTILNHHGVKHAIELGDSSAEHNSICSPAVRFYP